MMIGRWGRAARAIPADAERVLDVGCAFGYGTARLPGRLVVGVDRSARYLDRAARRYPRLPLVRGDALSLPFADASFDAVVALDVVEHLADPGAGFRELDRVLRPGGRLILSVPHRGLLWRWDSLNRYQELRRRVPGLPPLDDTESVGVEHRHFAAEEVLGTLGPAYAARRVERTGLGMVEALNLTLLLGVRAALRSEGLFRVLQYLYFTAYLVEDAIPSGTVGYHLFLAADKLGASVAATVGGGQ